jgi:hypothetical protein
MVELGIIEDTIAGPECRECGGSTWVVGIEEHPVVELTVVTTECLKCRLVAATLAMPAKQGGRHAR